MVYGAARDGMLVLAKMLYAIAFYHLGHLYKVKLEKIDRLGNGAYFGILFIIQYFLMVKTDGFPYISMWNGSITTMGKNIVLGGGTDRNRFYAARIQNSGAFSGRQRSCEEAEPVHQIDYAASLCGDRVF